MAYIVNGTKLRSYRYFCCLLCILARVLSAFVVMSSHYHGITCPQVLYTGDYSREEDRHLMQAVCWHVHICGCVGLCMFSVVSAGVTASMCRCCCDSGYFAIAVFDGVDPLSFWCVRLRLYLYVAFSDCVHSK